MSKGNLKYCINELAIFLLLLLASSCSDDPLTPQDPPGGIDTVEMYEWDIDTISGFLLYNIYVADSNNIFFEGPGGNMMYYDSKNYTAIPYNDPTFSSRSIDGFNENNVFISGVHYVSPGPAKPSLKIWNGSGFQGYEFPNDTGQSMLNVTAVGYNKAWMHNVFHDIYYFDNGNFTRYSVDSLLGGCVFYVSPNNETYLFSTGRGYMSYSINIGYKLIGNRFEIIYVDSVSTYSNLTGVYFPSKPFIFGGGYRAINIFNNNSWSLLCETANFYPDGVCSNTLNNLICYGESPSFWQDMFLWDGQKWSIEKNFYYFYRRGEFPICAQASRMFMVDDKVYLNYNNFDRYSSYLLKGKPIQRKEDKK